MSKLEMAASRVRHTLYTLECADRAVTRASADQHRLWEELVQARNNHARAKADLLKLAEEN